LAVILYGLFDVSRNFHALRADFGRLKTNGAGGIYLPFAFAYGCDVSYTLLGCNLSAHDLGVFRG